MVKQYYMVKARLFLEFKKDSIFPFVFLLLPVSGFRGTGKGTAGQAVPRGHVGRRGLRVHRPGGGGKEGARILRAADG